MRYSSEARGRLMVHLAGLINGCVEAEEGVGQRQGACFLVAETPDSL